MKKLSILSLIFLFSLSVFSAATDNGCIYKNTQTNKYCKAVETVYYQGLIIASSDVLALNSTPLTIITAPGASLGIQVISVSGKVTYNSTAYTGNTTLQIYTDTATEPQSENGTLLESTVTRTINFSTIEGGLTSNSTTQMIANKALKVKTKTGNPSSGNSTITIYILYRIIGM